MPGNLDPQKLRAGDPTTVTAFRAILRGFIRRRFQKRAQVSSLVNAALLELFEKLERGAQPAKPLYWALNAASNTVRRELTRLRRVTQTYESRLHGCVTADQSLILEARDELRHLDELLAEFDEIPAQIVAGAACGKAPREIAAELGITAGAVRKSLSRARADLREQLSSQDRLDELRQLAREAGLVLKPVLPMVSTSKSDSSSSSARA